jgi:hypothetical protein
MVRARAPKQSTVNLRWNRAQGCGGIALRALAGIALAALLSACAKPYNPFKIPSTELRGRVTTIALAPLVAGADLVDREYARAQIEPIVTKRLEAGGFLVIPSTEMERLWRRSASTVGGAFDPISGEADKKRLEAIREAVHRDLRAEHHADAVLYLHIAAVDLYITGPKVDYCGLSGDTVYWPAAGFSWGERTTLVLALCLDTELYDMEGRNLYGIRHGLETVETYFRQTRAVRPIDERLRDRVRLVQAVEATLGPLANPDAGR